VKYTLPKLPYQFDALEPVISAEIMQIHYEKHHQAYVNNLNDALVKYAEAEAKEDISGMIRLQPAIRFNGGGHINHSLLWPTLAPEKMGGGHPPKELLAERIECDFGSLEALITQMSAQAVAIQGSGWAWLVYNRPENRLQILCCANQDPVSTALVEPLLGIDVWEHAYYLQYKNLRADYVKNIWKIISWNTVEMRLMALLSTP
jgi:Fe-Mn family superoxide dismutase